MPGILREVGIVILFLFTSRENNRDIFTHKAFEKRLMALGRYDELAIAFDSRITITKVEHDREKLRGLPISGLKGWRNKILSHIDKDYVKNDIKTEKQHPIKTQQIEKIIETLHLMLNEYSLSYDFSTHSKDLTIEQGIKYILEAVKFKLTNEKANHLVQRNL